MVFCHRLESVTAPFRLSRGDGAELNLDAPRIDGIRQFLEYGRLSLRTTTTVACALRLGIRRSVNA